MDAVASLDSAMNRGYFSFVQVAELLDPMPAASSRLLDLVDPSCESGLETKARLSLKATNIPYRTQVVIPTAGRVDLLIGDRLVLELDGWEWHSNKIDFEKDRRKDLALHALEYQVMRLSYAQVSFGWSEALRVIRAKVSRGEHRWSERQRRGHFGT
ncbi:endonuclease domain-containing protein [Herbiconiux sp. P16]|uniref:endonuclease domain-containing protein n=1 Tax=Herbiconiux wuyangfengii TaxID=3342794 RepID=UPI0035BBEAD3